MAKLAAPPTSAQALPGRAQPIATARAHLETRTGFNLDRVLRETEKAYVDAALDITRGNLSQAAKLLGIHRTTLYSRMQSYQDAAPEKDR